jgi:hypothetical protein
MNVQVRIHDIMKHRTCFFLKFLRIQHVGIYTLANSLVPDHSRTACGRPLAALGAIPNFTFTTSTRTEWCVPFFRQDNHCKNDTNDDKCTLHTKSNDFFFFTMSKTHGYVSKILHGCWQTSPTSFSIVEMLKTHGSVSKILHGRRKTSPSSFYYVHFSDRRGSDQSYLFLKRTDRWQDCRSFETRMESCGFYTCHPLY